MPVGNDVCRLADTDILGPRGNVTAHHYRVGTDLETLVTEVMLGKPYGLPPVVIQVTSQFAGFLDYLDERFFQVPVVLIGKVAELHDALL